MFKIGSLSFLLLGCLSYSQSPAPKPDSPEALKRTKEIEAEIAILEAKMAKLKAELNTLKPQKDLAADADPEKFGDKGASLEGKTCYMTSHTKFVSYDSEKKIITVSQARGPDRSFLVDDACVSRLDRKLTELNHLKKGDITSIGYEEKSKKVLYTWTFINIPEPR